MSELLRLAFSEPQMEGERPREVLNVMEVSAGIGIASFYQRRQHPHRLAVLLLQPHPPFLQLSRHAQSDETDDTVLAQWARRVTPRRPGMMSWVGKAALRRAQRTSERQRAKIRRGLARHDEAMRRTLAFSERID